MRDVEPGNIPGAHPSSALLSPALTQLINDRFEEDQHGQATEILAQVLTRGLRPSKVLIQRLVALSLCSLTFRELASTSRWTLHYQLHGLSAKLLAQPKGSSRDQSAMKAASATSERPSPVAILEASSLLLDLVQAGSHDHAFGANTSMYIGDERDGAQMALHILKALPSRRKPLEDSRSSSPSDFQRRGGRGSNPKDHSDSDEPFANSSTERWIQEELHQSEDIWDLLCERRLSSVGDTPVSPGEFWMSASERKRYQKLLRDTKPTSYRLEDRLRDLQRRKQNGASRNSSSSSDSDDDLSDALPSRTNLGRGRKRPVKTESRQQANTKRLRAERSTYEREAQEDEHRRLTMTEGAWRTLRALVVLWEQTVPPKSLLAADADGPPLLWQFPRGLMDKQTSSKSVSADDAVDDVGRALDVALSFPRSLPAYIPPSSQHDPSSDLFDSTKVHQLHGVARSITSVPQAELRQREQIGNQKKEQAMMERAQTAARLLLCIYDLAKLGLIEAVALIEGISDRLQALTSAEAQSVLLPLAVGQPYLVAKVLTTYLGESGRPHPEHRRSATLSPLQIPVHGDGDVSLQTTIAFQVPHDRSATHRLHIHAKRMQDRDAEAVAAYLSLHRLNLDSSADESLPLWFPTKAESRDRSVVQRPKQRALKCDSTPRKKGKATNGSAVRTPPKTGDDLTDEEKACGLLALALVRALQMQERDRMNQLKFLLARTLTHALAGAESKGTAAGNDPSSRQGLKTFLSKLIKAYDWEVDDFEQCISSMESHHVADKARRQKVAPVDSKPESGSLPSLLMLTTRCRTYLGAAQSLARATRVLHESLAHG